MANCKNCKVSVGCGCNLKEGYCTYCYNQLKKSLIVTPPKQQDNVESTIDKLSRMF